ncbi:MAG: putative selenium-dependent hydroxylase accessory protein YqeC, partial [Haloferacaceae archaeon]
VATVLASREGGLKDVPPDATAIPLLTQVDTDADERAAREIADVVLERSDVPRVVFSRLEAIDVIE